MTKKSRDRRRTIRHLKSGLTEVKMIKSGKMKGLTLGEVLKTNPIAKMIEDSKRIQEAIKLGIPPQNLKGINFANPLNN